MAGNTETVSPGGESGRQLPPITDEYSAAEHLEGLLDLEDEAQEVTAGEAETGSQETDSTGDEEGQSEASETPIEPPKSWNAEDRELFAQLPKAQQEIVVRRETERDAAVNRHMQENADQRKAIEAERTAYQGERQQYLTTLGQLRLIAMPELQQLQNVDWQRLGAENPAEMVRLAGIQKAAMERIQYIDALTQRAQQQQAAEQTQRLAAFMDEQRTQLNAKEPTFADEVKGPALAKELGAWLETQGFTRDEIGQAADHRLMLLALKAMRAEQTATARKTAEVKKANPPPRVQTPGNTTSEDRGNRAAREGMSRLRQTGDVRDAGRLLETFITG